MCSCVRMYWSAQTHTAANANRSQWNEKISCRSVSMPHTRFGPHTSTRQANDDGKHTHTTMHRTLIENAHAYTHTPSHTQCVVLLLLLQPQRTVWSKPLLTLHRVLVYSKRKYYVLYSFHFSQFFFFFITIAVVVAVAVVVVAVVVFFFLVTNSPNKKKLCVFFHLLRLIVRGSVTWMQMKTDFFFGQNKEIINSICDFSVRRRLQVENVAWIGVRMEWNVQRDKWT